MATVYTVSEGKHTVNVMGRESQVSTFFVDIEINFVNSSGCSRERNRYYTFSH